MKHINRLLMPDPPIPTSPVDSPSATPSTSPGTAPAVSAPVSTPEAPEPGPVPTTTAPTPHQVHESFIQRVEQDFDELIAKAKAFVEHLVNNKSATVASLKAAAPKPETTALKA